MPLRIGRFELHQIRDGTFALDGGSMFGIVPRPLWAKTNPPDDRNRIPLVARCLLIVDGRRRILVDDGLGTIWNEKQRDIYNIDRGPFDLDRELARAGFSRADITDVVLTHLHFDHSGGTVRLENGAVVLSFPKATHHVQRRNWAWAHHTSERDRGGFRSDLFELLERSGRLHLLEGQHELAPGLELFLSEGHSVGVQLVRACDAGASLVFCGDLVPTSSHFKPTWSMAFDLYPLTAMEEKRVLLAQAVEDRSIIFFEHDPNIAACTVKEVEGEVMVDEVVPI